MDVASLSMALQFITLWSYVGIYSTVSCWGGVWFHFISTWYSVFCTSGIFLCHIWKSQHWVMAHVDPFNGRRPKNTWSRPTCYPFIIIYELPKQYHNSLVQHIPITIGGDIFTSEHVASSSMSCTRYILWAGPSRPIKIFNLNQVITAGI